MPHTAPGASVDVPASLRRRSTPGRAWWHATAENLFPFLIVGAAWELVARLQIFPARLFPPLEEVAVALVRLTASGILPHHALDTVVRLLAGFALAALVGVAIGFANIFVDTIAPQHGLSKADYQEVRMNVNDMVAAMAAKTVDAMVNVEPYNSIAEADGIAATIMNYWDVDKMPVFMAATPEFVQQHPDTVVAYLKAWLDVGREFKADANKVANTIYGFYTSKGYKMSRETFGKSIATVDVNPGFPSDLGKYMQEQAEILLREKKIKAIPDWKKALRPEFTQRAGG
jgi:ABC-type nitrate/sulfonate/bicarbonate transport system substrate-binding protein